MNKAGKIIEYINSAGDTCRGIVYNGEEWMNGKLVVRLCNSNNNVDISLPARLVDHNKCKIIGFID